MSSKALLGAADIAEILGVSKSKAYTIIREGNQELKSMHKLVISGNYQWSILTIFVIPVNLKGMKKGVDRIGKYYIKS